MAWREEAVFGEVTATSVTATSVTSTAIQGAQLGISFSVGTEATNAITTAITVTGAVSAASMGAAVALPFYISSDAAGQVLEAGTDLALTAGTDGLVILSGGDSKVYGTLVTETTGEMDLIITDTGIDTYYINVIMPDGRVGTSAGITFA